MRLAAYISALLGTLLAIAGVTEHLVLRVEIVQHLGVGLVVAGAICVLIGFMQLRALNKRERSAIEAAVRTFERSEPGAKHWVLD